MADVFISSSMETASEIARDIADALQARGISCWYAGKHEEIGEYAEAIVTAIENCRVFLLVMNRAAIRSFHVKTETAFAFRRLNNDENIILVPFRVEDCSPTENKALDYYLILQDIVDGCPPDAEHIQGLIHRLATALKV